MSQKWNVRKNCYQALTKASLVQDLLLAFRINPTEKAEETWSFGIYMLSRVKLHSYVQRKTLFSGRATH